MYAQGSRHVADLLDDYINRKLNDSQSKVVEAHVATCKACAVELAFRLAVAKATKRYYARQSLDHVDTAILADLALGGHNLSPESKNKALEHIASCPQCRKHYETAKGVADDLNLEPIPSPSESHPGPDLAKESEMRRGLMVRNFFLFLFGRWRYAAVAFAAAFLTFAIIELSKPSYPPGITSSPSLGEGSSQPFATSQVRGVKSPPEKALSETGAATSPTSTIGATLPPRVLYFDAGTKVGPDEELDLARLEVTARVVTLARQENLLLIIERPRELVGKTIGCVQIYKVEGSAAILETEWSKFAIPREGKIPLMIPSEILQPGTYAISVQPTEPDQTATFFPVKVNLESAYSSEQKESSK